MTLSEERFYYDLNSHDVETLITKIQSGNPSFSLEKMIEKGLLPEKNSKMQRRNDCANFKIVTLENNKLLIFVIKLQTIKKA